jgi:hypothetical protein
MIFYHYLVSIINTYEKILFYKSPGKSQGPTINLEIRVIDKSPMRFIKDIHNRTVEIGTETLLL